MKIRHTNLYFALFVWMFIRIFTISNCHAVTVDVGIRGREISQREFTLFKSFINDELHSKQDLTVVSLSSDSTEFRSVPDFKNSSTDFIIIFLLEKKEQLFFAEINIYKKNNILVCRKNSDGIESATSFAAMLPGLIHEISPVLDGSIPAPPLSSEHADEPESAEVDISAGVPSSTPEYENHTSPDVPADSVARIFFASIPPVADVLFQGRLIGKTNVSELTLPVGTVELEFVKGRKKFSKQVTLKAGANPSQMIRLQ